MPKPSFPWSDPPDDGAPCEVAPGIFWVRMPLPFRLDHINLWMLEDGTGWTIVDTGYAGDDETRRRWKAIFETGRCPTRVLVTHFHADHLGLAGWICDTFEAPLWISRAEWLNGHLRRHVWSEEQIRQRGLHYRASGLGESEVALLGSRDGALARAVTPVPIAYKRLIDGQTVEIGGRDWIVITGEGHSPEHVALYCPGLKILISGDQVLPTISPHVGVWPEEPDGDPLGSFLASLEKFRTLPEDTLVLPAHGLPFFGLHARIDALLTHHGKRLAQAEEACRDWRTGAEITALLFRPPADTHQLSLALSESLAHLHQLLYAGRVTLETGRDGVRRFLRTA